MSWGYSADPPMIDNSGGSFSPPPPRAVMAGVLSLEDALPSSSCADDDADFTARCFQVRMTERECGVGGVRMCD